MITAKELRIGNWVLKYEYLTGKYQKGVVDGSYLKWVADNHTRCEPIPLTPELLDQCGFVRISVDIYRCNYFDIHFDEERYWFETKTGEVVRETEIEALHQLQNLYWCVCGEELQITL